MSAPRVLVMGVSGSGKSTIGERLARRLGVPFIEADDFHPQHNRDKLHAGIPLDDADRAPWLATIHEQLAAIPGGWVLACSALKRTYRETLFDGIAGVRTVLLHAPEEEVARRLEGRTGHFSAPEILRSQLATLEPPEDAITIEDVGAHAAIVEQLIAGLG
jgi:gluconokinase